MKNKSDKNWFVVMLLCLFTGWLGFHRFYVGKKGSGFLYMFTIGFCGIGQIIDLIKILCGSFEDSEGNKIYM